MRFRDVSIGQTFWFPKDETIFRHFHEGPYVKTDVRKYRRDPQQFTIQFTRMNGKPSTPQPIVYKVGSINVNVVTSAD